MTSPSMSACAIGIGADGAAASRNRGHWPPRPQEQLVERLRPVAGKLSLALLENLPGCEDALQ
eukprot:5826640-Pyramimonas_sp.AAC.1